MPAHAPAPSQRLLAAVALAVSAAQTGCCVGQSRHSCLRGRRPLCATALWAQGHRHRAAWPVLCAACGKTWQVRKCILASSRNVLAFSGTHDVLWLGKGITRVLQDFVHRGKYHSNGCKNALISKSRASWLVGGRRVGAESCTDRSGLRAALLRFAEAGEACGAQKNRINAS